MRNFILPRKEKKRKKILVFSLLLREFRNVKNEMLCYPVGGAIFQIIVVRLLLLALARALNSRSIAFYKKMDERVQQQIKTEENICTREDKTGHALVQ